MSSKGTQNNSPPSWHPTTFVRFEKAFDTSMGTARIVTDEGPAYIKAMGNREGPHALACEVVATRLAKWFGLPTFDFAIIEIDAEYDEIPYIKGGFAESGPAFVSKAAIGHPWGGDSGELANLVNPCDIAKLIVFDTWVLNCDRHLSDSEQPRVNLDNVFLEDLTDDKSGSTRLIALDQTHCFTCGGELSKRASEISRVKDERIYGLFPGFRDLVCQEDVENAIDRLGQVEEKTIHPMVEEIPRSWQVDDEAKKSLIDLIVRRADYVEHNILQAIGKECWPDQLFDKR